jgi:formylmethanofuran dehydrogenase subunit B
MIDIEQFLMSLRRHKDADGKLKPIYLADILQEEIKIIQEAIKQSQRWVGLTNEEIQNIGFEAADRESAVIQAEDKLKEKNGG